MATIDDNVVAEFCRAFGVKAEVDCDGAIIGIASPDADGQPATMPIATLAGKTSYIGFFEGYTGENVGDTLLASGRSNPERVVSAYIEGYRAGERMRGKSQ